MSYTVTGIGSAYAGGGSGPSSASVTFTPVIGDYYVIAADGQSAANPLTVSVSAPFGILVAEQPNTNTPFALLAGWTATTTASTTATVSSPGTGGWGMAVLHISGAASVAVDGSNGFYNLTAVSSQAFPAITPLGTGRLWIGVGMNNWGSWTLTPTTSGSFTFQSATTTLGAPLYDTVYWYELPSATAYAPTISSTSADILAGVEVLIYGAAGTQIVMMPRF